MEHEKFIKFLQEHAELEQVRAPITSQHREPNEPETVWRLGQEVSITKNSNPTQSVKIKRLKPQAKMCEDCGKICEDRVIYRKLYTDPVKHWRETCNGCQLTRNPTTKQFSISNSIVNHYFQQILQKRNK